MNGPEDELENKDYYLDMDDFDCDEQDYEDDDSLFL